MVGKFIDIIFPRSCYGCGSLGSYLCQACVYKHLKPNYIQKCHVCKGEVRHGFIHIDCKELSYLDGLINLGIYDDFSKKLIRELKYNDVYSLSREIGSAMGEYLGSFYNLNDYVLVPVPLYNSKQRSRGFNQAELIAKEISRVTDIQVVNLLERVLETKTQVGMSKEERGVNLKNAFQVNPNFQIANTKVLLVDDVYTTGTTMNECANVLKVSGVENVIGYSFVKG